MTKILVFDTETTSLPEKKHNSFDKQKEHERKMLSVSELKKEGNSWSTELEKYPSIIQLAYILYDTDNPSNSKIFNKYIDIPESINISSESQKIHGISKEKIGLMDLFKKASIEDSLNEFMDDFNEADIVVGHNVDFDRRMIVAELLRLSKEKNIPHIKEIMKDENFECTQEITTPICNLKVKFQYVDPKTKIPKYIYKIKSAKLIEAYEHYFGYKPAGEHMHDAIIDVVVCLRVYGMSFPGGQAFDVCNTNSKIKDMILNVSPHNQKTCEETQHYLEQAGDGFLMPGVFPVVDKPEAKSASKSNSQAKSKSEPHSASKSKSEPHPASKTASKHDSKV
jgi:DNA polymerase III epsilon subunit-like protein